MSQSLLVYEVIWTGAFLLNTIDLYIEGTVINIYCNRKEFAVVYHMVIILPPVVPCQVGLHNCGPLVCVVLLRVVFRGTVKWCFGFCVDGDFHQQFPNPS